MVPFDRPHMTSYQSYIATMSLSCTVSEILSLISQNLKRSRDSEHIRVHTSTTQHRNRHSVLTGEQQV